MPKQRRGRIYQYPLLSLRIDPIRFQKYARTYVSRGNALYNAFVNTPLNAQTTSWKDISIPTLSLRIDPIRFQKYARTYVSRENALHNALVNTPLNAQTTSWKDISIPPSLVSESTL